MLAALPGIPVIILFEGWRGAQRSVIINHMMQQMDARGFRVYSASKMADEEPDQPFFEPFWRQLPAKAIWLCITAAGTI